MSKLWMGDIPHDWKISKLKYLGEYINGYAFKPEDWSEEGLPIIRIQDLTGSNNDPNFFKGTIAEKYRIKNGDILVSWAATLDAFVWNRDEGWLNQHIFKAVPNLKEVTEQYFFWLLKAAMHHLNNDNKHGIMMQHLTLSVFNNFPVPLPSIETQKHISKSLGEKCAYIDGLIANVEHQIAKLKSYKLSLVIESVTRGTKHCAMKPTSTIEWLSEIPSHWEECRIKNVIFPQNKEVEPSDQIITCFRDGEVTLRSKRREEGYTISLTEHGYHGVDVGDLVIHGMDAFAGAIGCSDSRGKTTPVVHVCNTSGCNRYFMYYLRAMAYGNILMDLSNGVRVRSSDYRNFDRLGVFGIAVPPIEEQQAIANLLDSKCKQIDKLISVKQAKIEKLENYRETLIYEYITGKKEVI